MKRFLILVLVFSFFNSCMLAQDAQIQGTVHICNQKPDYTKWKLKRIHMQLQREHNNVTICSLLQPSAVIGSVVFGTMAVALAVSVFSGNGARNDAKDLVKSIQNFIELVKAPFTLQYEKNKANDRIAELDEERVKRESIQIS